MLQAYDTRNPHPPVLVYSTQLPALLAFVFVDRHCDTSSRLHIGLDQRPHISC